MAIVDLEQNTGYTLSSQQTEAGLSSQENDSNQGSRIGFYLGHLGYCINCFPE